LRGAEAFSDDLKTANVFQGGGQMDMTKEINVYQQQERKIRCIGNRYDYTGDGSAVKTEPIIPGKEYTFLRGERQSYGEMVHIAEIPKLYGFPEELFEETEAYETDVLKQARENWLVSELQIREASIEAGGIPDDEAFRQLEQELKREAQNTIETDRLLLWPSEEDRDLWFYHKHLREDGDFELFTGLPYSEDKVKLMRLTGSLYFTVVLKESQIMIGYVAYQETSGEVEFYIFRDWRRQGYGKEALTALMDRIFSGSLLVEGENGLQQLASPTVISADTLAENEAAIRFMESCGFQEKANCAVMFKAFIRENADESSAQDMPLQPIRYFEIRREDLPSRLS